MAANKIARLNAIEIEALNPVSRGLKFEAQRLYNEYYVVCAAFERENAVSTAVAPENAPAIKTNMKSKRRISAAARKRIIAAQKRRWANAKAKKEEQARAVAKAEKKPRTVRAKKERAIGAGG